MVYPAPDRSPVLSWQIVQFLRQSLPQPQSSQTGEGSSSVAIAFLGFSAGVVGALGAAHLWQHQGGQVQCLMALDGWGVPLWGDFPIHRLSHDSWTHWTTGGGQSSTADFYADPAVTHLDLWRAPQRVWGWRVHAGQQQRCCATDFIGQILSHPT
uniref:hypothetical protein n=1 Tax=Petrachloros mirabilis TaxID=2918835 RepID=UPI001EE7F3C9|nr:hypothetical protein [Petrachloros mirabilis]